MAEVEISGYKIYRADRKGRKHTRGRYSGGVALYLRKDIAATSEQMFNFSNGVVESACNVLRQREPASSCDVQTTR